MVTHKSESDLWAMLNWKELFRKPIKGNHRRTSRWMTIRFRILDCPSPNRNVSESINESMIRIYWSYYSWIRVNCNRNWSNFVNQVKFEFDPVNCPKTFLINELYIMTDKVINFEPFKDNFRNPIFREAAQCYHMIGVLKSFVSREGDYALECYK